MKFETIPNKKKRVGISIGIISVIAVIGITAFTLTRASYKQTQSVPLIKGNISYNKSDLEIVAIKLQQDDGTYTDATEVPSSGYILNTDITKSYCRVGNTTNEVDFTYENEKYYINAKEKGTKCTLSFDINKCKDGQIACNTILTNKTIQTRTNFNDILAENTTGKIYKTQDNDGNSYYFAGEVDNNWIIFGQENGENLYWRIIRINGDGSIRLFYNGTTTPQTANASSINNGTAYKFSHKDAWYDCDEDSGNFSSENAYVGYMYGTPRSSTYIAEHANINSSNAKQEIDKWYNINLNNPKYSKYIDTNAGFCGDRGVVSGTGIGVSVTKYSAYNRLYTSKMPTLKCENINDLYTVGTSSKGNKALTYPIGMISADEVMFAGSYLYNQKDSYWTMTPHSNNNGSGCKTNTLYAMSSNNILTSSNSSNLSSLRPVINIKADTIIKGDGTSSNPYIVY